MVSRTRIEQAHSVKKTDFLSFISNKDFKIEVSLFPKLPQMGNLCPACECGSKLKVKVYQFLKEPLIRKYE